MRSKTYEILLKGVTWSAQIWLAMLLITASLTKIEPEKKIVDTLLLWTAHVSPVFVKAVGVWEFLLGVLVILNLLLFPRSRTLPLAGAALIVIGCGVFALLHIVFFEPWFIVLNVIMLFLCGVIGQNYSSDRHFQILRTPVF